MHHCVPVRVHDSGDRVRVARCQGHVCAAEEVLVRAGALPGPCEALLRPRVHLCRPRF